MLNNVTVWLEQTASKFPDKLAFCDEYKSLTYRGLSSQAKAIAMRLIRLGIFKKPIAVFSQRERTALPHSWRRHTAEIFIRRSM